MKLLRTALTTCVVALLAGGVALAQGSGGLVIKVIDGEGQPLPGATVTIEHEAGNVKPYTTLSSGRGQADFPVLRPGTGYIVTVSFPGFGTRREENIRVPIGDTAVIPIQLAEEIVERVRVVATEDVVELESTSSSSKFSDEFVQDLPVPGRFYQNVLTLAPGVNDPDGDGNPTVHGSRSRDFKATVSGVSNVDPLTGQQMSFVNADSIEEMEVVSSGAGVEFGRAQGGFARIIQKQGTNQFEGTFGFLYRTSKLDGTGANDTNNTPDPEFGEVHPSIIVSGPVIKDKLWYRLSYELLDQQDPVNTTNAIVTQDTVRGIHSDALTWQVSPRNKLMFQWQSDPLEITNLGVSSTTPVESSRSLNTDTTTYSITWTAPFSPKLLVESTLAYQDLESIFEPTSASIDNDCTFGLFEDALCNNTISGQQSGSHFLTQSSNSQRITLASQATLYAGQIWGANHQFKFGLAVENERYFQQVNRRPIVTAFERPPDEDGGGEDDLGAIVINANIAVPQISGAKATGTNWGIYFEDQVKPTSNFVLTWGFRIDREELNAEGDTAFNPTAEQQQYLEYYNDPNISQPLVGPVGGTSPYTSYPVRPFLTELAAASGVSADALLGKVTPALLQADGFWNRVRGYQDFSVTNTNISPAISLSWDPWSTGKNKFAASARRYYDKVVLLIPLTENLPSNANIQFIGQEGPNGFEISTQTLEGNLNPTANLEVVDRNLKTPYQDEWRIMYERELFTETLMRVEYINRKYRDQLQNRDINHAPADLGSCIVDAGNTRPLVDISNGPDGILDDCVGDRQLNPRGAGEPALQVPDNIADLYVQNPLYGTVQQIGNFNSADYDSFVFELIRRQYRSWEMSGSYTWSKATGNGEDYNQNFLGLDPTLADDEFGYQSNDQRHLVKMQATSITPWGFRVGGSLSWASGLPYSVFRQRLSADPVPPQLGGFGSNPPRRNRFTYPTQQRNDQRNDSQWLFNLKFTKELNLGRGLNLQLSAEIFNLFNDGTYKVYDRGAETGYQINGIDTAFQEFGRRWQLGMRLSF